MFWFIISLLLGAIAVLSLIYNSIQNDLISELRYENAHLKNYIQTEINN